MTDQKATADLFRLDGRTAIITGGGGLLGSRYADAIAEMGGIPILWDLPASPVESVAKQLSEKGKCETAGMPVDITKIDQVRRAVEQVMNRFGRIDILINNAALTGKAFPVEGMYAPFEEYSLELWNKALEVNLTGVFIVTQAVGKMMVAAQRGVVVNIASDVALISPDHRIYQNLPAGKSFNTPISYSTTKAALLNFTRHLATYWAPAGIRVNAICPAGVYDNQDPEFVKRLSNLIPLGRMAHKHEYMAPIIYLVSDASSFMTGSILVVDGGRTAW